MKSKITGPLYIVEQGQFIKTDSFPLKENNCRPQPVMVGGNQCCGLEGVVSTSPFEKQSPVYLTIYARKNNSIQNILTGIHD